MVEGKPDNSKDQLQAPGADSVTPPEVRETEYIDDSELFGRDAGEAEKPAAAPDAIAAEADAEELADRVPPAQPAALPERETPLPPPPPKSASPLLPLLSGAVGAAIVVGAAWFTLGQNLTPAQGDAAALEALKTQLASVEAKADTAAKAAASNAAPSAPAAASAEPDPAVTRRIEALEKSVAALRDDVAAAAEKAAQLSAAVNATKLAPAGEAGAAAAAAPPPADLAEFSERLMQLEAAAKMPAAAPAVDLTPITERLTQVEAALKAVPVPVDLSAVNEHLAKLDAAVAKPPSFDDTALRRVVAALLLDTSVRQGEAFAPLLEVAKPLAADAAALKSLDGFAATGLPNDAALSRELVALRPKLIPGYEPLDSTASIVDRLQAGADRLVRFPRSAGERSAILWRAIAAAQRNDVTEAKRELSALQPDERAAAQAWLDRANARDAALAASRQFAAAAMAALPKTSP